MKVGDLALFYHSNAEPPGVAGIGKKVALVLYDSIIIGGGAAGLMTAISAARRGKSALILEINKAPGMKILISGGGRCNFTNLKITADDYVSENPHFCKSAFGQFTQDDFIRLVEEAGIPYYEKTLGQLFCRGSSKEIVRLLIDRLGPNTTLKTGTQIQSVQKEQDQFTIRTADENFEGKSLVIATGGLSFPKLGATDLGYTLAKQFGHTITPLAPALDGFIFSHAQRKIFSDLSGISLEVKLTVGQHSFTENILFTHVGLSGPGALKGSLFWEKNDPIEIDFLPHLADFSGWLEEQRTAHPRKLMSSTLATLVVARFAETLLQIADIPDIHVTHLKKEQMQALKAKLKHFICVPVSTVGYDKAEVTRGGVDTKDLSSKTMESKLVPGLFFVGEVVDVTGLLGGYNFQWAWSSGWVAGQNV